MQIHVHGAVFVSRLNIHLNYLNILQVKIIVWLGFYFFILVFRYLLFFHYEGLGFVIFFFNVRYF